MSKKRRQHSPDLKARVGLEALKGIEPVHAIAAKYQVHPVQVSQWKKEAVGAASRGVCPQARRRRARRPRPGEGAVRGDRPAEDGARMA
jgi:transposase-like protein